jgi:flagella basal body P-ring formation protein FlgA
MKILFFEDSNGAIMPRMRLDNKIVLRSLLKGYLVNMKLLRKAYVVEHCAWMIRMMQIVMELK